MTLPALVLLGEASPRGEGPPAVDIAVDLLPVDVNVTGSHLLWAAQFAAALPHMGPPPEAEPGPDKPAPIGGRNDVCTDLQARSTLADSA